VPLGEREVVTDEEMDVRVREDLRPEERVALGAFPDAPVEEDAVDVAEEELRVDPVVA